MLNPRELRPPASTQHTLWDIKKSIIETQLIGHDKEVYDEEDLYPQSNLYPNDVCRVRELDGESGKWLGLVVIMGRRKEEEEMVAVRTVKEHG
ncbi:hypothetical protein V6N13_138931 [Hibiscus sabdariffa]|uniref:Uncharacterized protein n=1 Tax=Hibiscus sabdariffa TaxID=183260 RepID=A0ABR2PKC2_9ROSI